MLCFITIFFIVFSSCRIKVKRPFHETYAPVICNHAPRPDGGGGGGGGKGGSRAKEPFLILLLI